MEFLASDFKRKGRKKINIYMYVAIPTPNLRVLPAENPPRGGSAPWWGCSAPKSCFLPRKADSKAQGGLVVVKEPSEVPASYVWGGDGRFFPASRVWGGRGRLSVAESIPWDLAVTFAPYSLLDPSDV